MSELVSVIIPAYNKGVLLLEAVDSVLAQTYPDLEVIVVDDGSTEDIESMLKKYPSDKVRYAPIPHSGHPSVVRNTGLSLARGSLIAFLDSDDRWAPEKLAEQVQVLRDNPNIGLVSSDAYIIEHEKVVPGLSFLDIYSGIRFGEAMSGDLWEELLFDNFIVTSTVLLRRSLIARAGLFSTSEKQRISQDYDLWLRIAAVSDIYYLPKNLAYYRTAGGLHNEETRQMYWNGMLDLFTGLSAYLSRIGGKKGSVDLANRRVFEMKSYISLSNRDIVRSFVNLSGYFYYRLKAVMAL